MTVYLDTSVVLSWLLNQEPSIEDWPKNIGAGDFARFENFGQSMGVSASK